MARIPAFVATREPTMFLLGFALWALLSAASLLAPGEVFVATPIYAALRRLPMPEEAWGALMLLDGLALAITACRGGAWARAGIAAVSAPFWCFFGAEVLIGAARAGIFSAVGAWCVLGSLLCAVAAAQWAMHAAPDRQALDRQALGRQALGRQEDA